MWSDQVGFGSQIHLPRWSFSAAADGYTVSPSPSPIGDFDLTAGQDRYILRTELQSSCCKSLSGLITYRLALGPPSLSPVESAPDSEVVPHPAVHLRGSTSSQDYFGRKQRSSRLDGDVTGGMKRQKRWSEEKARGTLGMKWSVPSGSIFSLDDRVSKATHAHHPTSSDQILF